MSWQEEYEAAHKKEEGITRNYVTSLEKKIEVLEKESRRKHRKAVFLALLGFLGFFIAVYEVWHYARH